MTLVTNYTAADNESAAEALKEAFLPAPWNEKWTLEEARERILELSHAKNFLGLLLKEDGKVVGMALGRILTFPEGKVAELEEFSLRPSYQGKGEGKRLIQAFEARAWKQGSKEIRLLTHPGYACVDFYKRIGYTKSKTALCLAKEKQR